MSGERMDFGIFKIFTKMPIIGRFRISNIAFPIYMLVTTPQKISGWLFKIIGPGVTPWTIKAARISAVIMLKGTPNVNKGKNYEK